MYYKTFARRLRLCGWEIADESHGGNIYPHYFKYEHPADTEGHTRIEFVCTSNKNGTPGKILKMWQDGKPCRV